MKRQGKWIAITLALLLVFTSMSPALFASTGGQIAGAKSTVQLPGDPLHPEDIYLVGQEVHYALQITNTHPSQSMTVDIIDIDPSAIDTTTAGNLLNPIPPAAIHVMETGITIPAGQSWNGTFDYVIQASDLFEIAGVKAIKNTLKAEGLQGLESVFVEVTKTSRVVSPEISISKQADTEVSKIGDTVNYSFEVENTGDWTLVDVTITDPLLGGDITSEFVFFGTLIPFTGTLEPGEVIEATIPYVVEEGKTDPLENEATAEGRADGFDALITGAVVSDTATASVQLVTPSILLTKSVTPSEGFVGDMVTYTIRIENTGDWALENIVVTDSMKGDLSAFFPATLAAFGEAGYFAEYSYDYVILETDKPGPIENTADVLANPVGLPNEIRSSDSATVTILTDQFCYEDETAWAFGNIPFCEIGLANWGWSNGPLQEGVFERDLFAGAAGCDPEKGMLVGKVIITYLDGCVTVDFELDPGFMLMETHVWISEEEPLPFTIRPGKKGGKVYNSAPGQLGFMAGETYCGFEGGIYVAAHAVVGIPVPCEPE